MTGSRSPDVQRRRGFTNSDTRSLHAGWFLTVDVGQLVIEGQDAVEPARGIRFPLMDLFAFPLFLAAVRTWDPFPAGEHAERITIGRTVLRRETWDVPAGDTPRQLRHAAAETHDGRVRFTEMLPTPDQCWLQDDNGNAFTSELRLVSVDLARRNQIGRR